MPTKGMRTVFFHTTPGAPPDGSPRKEPPASPPPKSSFCSALMEDNVAGAENIITKWDPEGSNYARITSIFYESRDEARRFLRAISDLRRAMHFFASDMAASESSSFSSTPPALIQAQQLMEVAMSRLRKEFHQILVANRDRLDHESLSSARSSLSTATSASCSDLECESSCTDDDECRRAAGRVEAAERLPATVMADLRAIVETMVANGYGKECFDIYTTARKSIVDEALSRLGFAKFPQQAQKLDWSSFERRVKNWVSVAKVAVSTLFAGERVLSDFVFGFPSSRIRLAVKESCFVEITRDAAVEFFAFPELLAMKAKKVSSPEKVFHFLDLHDTISGLWPEIEAVFSYESTSTVKTQALTALSQLGDTIRFMLADFELQLQKYSSRDVVPGGGLHPLTRYAMNYLIFLADYAVSLSEIYAQYPLPHHVVPLPESLLSFINNATASAPSSPSYFTEEEEFIASNPTISSRFAWLLLVLLCKLDVKAGLYKNAALSYLFLANNLQYVANKVTGSRLRSILGDEWVAKHEEKARSFARSCERSGWRKVAAAVLGDPVAMATGSGAAREEVRRFNKAFEEAYREQSKWVVVDSKMRDELKVSIARNIIVPYREFYNRYKTAAAAEGRVAAGAAAAVRFSPEDLGNYISDLFYGNAVTSESSTHHHTESKHRSSEVSRWWSA